MKKLDALEALELQIQVWEVVIEKGCSQKEATNEVLDSISEEHSIGCFLCEFNNHYTKEGYECRYCPIKIVTEVACINHSSPYFEWSFHYDKRTKRLAKLIHSYLLGILAEWNRMEEC